MEVLPKITQTAHRGKLPRYNLTATDANTRTTLVHQTPDEIIQRTMGEPKPSTKPTEGRGRNKKRMGVPPDIRLPELSNTYYHETTCPAVLYVETK